MKVKFIPSIRGGTNIDQLSDGMFLGLYKYLGRQNIFDCPSKQSFHIPPDPSLQVFTTCFHNLSFCVPFKDYDITVVTVRYDVDCSWMLDIKQPFVILDGYDTQQIYWRALNKSNCIKYFKRQLSKRDQNKSNKLIHLPMRSPRIQGIDPDIQRDVDVIFIGGFASNPSRRSHCMSIIKRFRNKYNLMIKNTSPYSNNNISFKDYVGYMNRSKIVLHLNRNGWNRQRLWQMPQFRSRMIIDRPPEHLAVNVNNYFEAGTECIYFKNQSQLLQGIQYALKQDRWKQLGNRCYRRWLKDHTVVKRAQFVINNI